MGPNRGFPLAGKHYARVGRGIAATAAMLIFLLTAVGVAAACTSDAECDDGELCNGIETCGPGQTCQPGTPMVDGFRCEDDDICTTSDVCEGGVCVGTGGADTDADGYCDAAEQQVSCNPLDPAEIPLQANVFSGGRSQSGGEVLLAFRAPSDRDVSVATNPICATSGTCHLATGLCTAGKVADPCLTDTDCNQPANTCRLVVNYAGVPDLGVQLPGERRPAFSVTLKVARMEAQDLSAAFTPITPGCTRKVDVVLPPVFTRGAVKLIARGTTAGRRRSDRDRLNFTP
ncbi:hypothetical protein L6Q96_18290 [Candidatus Binatia bacterium]|nr:hypothetical protein [Candidatus Binatia bacterium]